jgi:hypothetical protein
MLTLALLFSVAAATSQGKEIETNEVDIPNAPSWLTELRVQKCVEDVQRFLEWDVRKITVLWYTDPGTFQRAHGFDETVLAFERKTDNTVHIGPRIDTTNFDKVFEHELVHVILAQKFKDAIPKWLEEGLANYVAKKGDVDYAWLASIPPPPDVRVLIHPFMPIAADGVYRGAKYHYMASRALIEMIASKCDLKDLLGLSVGSKLEKYLSTYCGVADVNVAFAAWLNKKRQPSASPRPS